MLLPEKVVPFRATLAWSHDDATLIPLFTLVKLAVSQSAEEGQRTLGDAGGVFGDDVGIDGDRGEFSRRALESDND